MDRTDPERVAVVIEDDEDIRELLAIVLRQAGFSVHLAASGLQGATLVRTHQPLLTTVDISLPDIDGFEVTRRIRTFSETFIVMITARAEEIDTLLGLEAGADEYLTKPFRPRELRARIEAILRRARPVPAMAAAQGSAPAAVLTRNGVLTHSNLRVDTHVRSVYLDDARVHLTRSEYEIISALLAADGRVVSKAELVRAVWPENYLGGAAVAESEKRSVEVHVANLRRKLGEDASHPRLIETVRGYGYRMAATD